MQVLQLPTMAQWDAGHKEEERKGGRENCGTQELERNWEHGGGMGPEIGNTI